MQKLIRLFLIIGVVWGFSGLVFASQLTLETDSLEVVFPEETIYVPGTVNLLLQDQLITGALLRYDWGSHSGVINDFRTVADGLIITGAEAHIEGDIVYLKRASITKCDLPQPEFEIYSRLLTFDLTTKRLTTRGTWIKVYGYKVIPEPDFSVKLDDSRFGQESRDGMPRPIFGWDSTRGFYGGATYQNLIGDDKLLRGQLVYGAKTGFEGEATYINQVGEKGLFTANWVRDPELTQPLGGFRLDQQLAGGDLALVAGQYQEENEQILRYLPELRFNGRPVNGRRDNFTYQVTPTLRAGQIQAVESPLTATRLGVQTPWSWRYLLGKGLYFSGSGGLKLLAYTDQLPYWELTNTVYLKKQIGHSTWGLGYQNTRLDGKPYFKELKPATPVNDGLLSYQYRRGWLGQELTALTTLRYDLDKSRFRTATYGLRYSRNWGEAKVISGVTVEQNLVTAAVQSVSYSGSLNLEDWVAGSDLKYSYQKEQWETGEVFILRKLHCYDIKFEYDLVEERLGTKILFNW